MNEKITVEKSFNIASLMLRYEELFYHVDFDNVELYILASKFVDRYMQSECYKNSQDIFTFIGKEDSFEHYILEENRKKEEAKNE